MILGKEQRGCEKRRNKYEEKSCAHRILRFWMLLSNPGSAQVIFITEH
jgi:hypothetical protein